MVQSNWSYSNDLSNEYRQEFDEYDTDHCTDWLTVRLIECFLDEYIAKDLTDVVEE